MSSSMSKRRSHAPHAAKRDRLLGLGLIAVAFITALGISLRSKQASLPLVSPPPEPPRTDGIEGFPEAVKPLSLEPLARRLTARDQLVGASFSKVTPEGTLNAQNGGARFVYRSLEGQGPEPARPYGTLAARKYCGFQVVRLTSAGLGAEADVADADCRRAIEPLPAPNCSLEQLWELARQRGAGSESADIDYYRSRSGPAWYFESGSTRFAVGADCRTLLPEQEAASVGSRRVPG